MTESQQTQTTEAADQTATDLQASDPSVSFAEAAEESQPGLVREFVEFLGESKKWWLLPILIVLALVGLLVLLSGSVAAPFIYPFV
jgi:hypothetical protein